MHTRRASRRTVLTALCGLIVGSTTNENGVAAASDEPSDPGRSGATDDGPTIDDPDERWWRAGTGTSGPTLADGGAFVATEGGAVLSLDAADGEERWRIAVDDDVVGSPATDGAVVYIGS
jgi:outer membrane protein assembly factor BamB